VLALANMASPLIDRQHINPAVSAAYTGAERETCIGAEEVSDQLLEVEV